MAHLHESAPVHVRLAGVDRHTAGSPATSRPSRAPPGVTSGADESILGEFTMIVRIDLDGHDEVGARDDLYRDREAGSAVRVGAGTLGARSPAPNDIGRPQ